MVINLDEVLLYCLICQCDMQLDIKKNFKCPKCLTEVGVLHNA